MELYGKPESIFLKKVDSINLLSVTKCKQLINKFKNLTATTQL